MIDRKYLTNSEVLILADKLAMKIEAETDARPIYVYGVPRGGVPVAYALAASSQHIQVVDHPENATVIVDDIIDSGATKNRYLEAYFEKPFYALVENSPEWVVFPWEQREADSTALDSATDIPLRLLQYIGEDPKRGGLIETPKRYLKAWEHYTSGYGLDAKDILKTFDDGADNYDEMIIVKDIPIFSHCEHHLCPFFGVAHIAYIPDKSIVGLSKLVRLADIFMRRLQVQERLTVQIAEAIMTSLQPLGVGIVIDCVHTCMIGRGVQVQGANTITSSMLGVFKENIETRQEFMNLIKG